MATSNKSKKILEKARKVAAKTKKKKVSKVDVKKKTTSFPEGQNAPQSKRYTQEADKSLGAKNTGWRWTKEGAKKLGKDANAKPSQSDIETYRNETFKLKGKPNKSGPKGVGDGSHRYLYIERRADKADIKRSQKLAHGGSIDDKRERVIDYYLNNDVFDDYDTYGLIEQDLMDAKKSKSYKKIEDAIVKYHGLDDDENVEERFEVLGLGDDDEYAKGGKTKDKKAVVVSFNPMTRVIVSSKDSEEKIVEKAREKMRDDLSDYLSVENLDEIKDDSEMPYNEKDDYAKGGYMANGGITKDELKDFKSYVKSYYGKGEIYEEFFPPIGASNDEIELAIRMYVSYCKTKEGQWGRGDTFDREFVRDVMLYNRGQKTKLEYQRAVKEIVKHYKNKSFEYGGILQPMIGGVNADPRFDIYNTTMFAKKGAELPKGGETKDGKIKFYKVVDEIGNLEYDGDPHDKRLHSETTFSWGAKDEDEYERAEKLIGQIGEKGNGWEVYAIFDYSGYGYWMKQMREPNYIRLAVIFKDSYVDENEIGRIESALYEAIMEAERISNAFDYDPSEDKDDDDYAKGGKTKEQGYDDREDESLAMRHGKISSKDFVGSHHKKEHSRRDDARFETRDK